MFALDMYGLSIPFALNLKVSVHVTYPQ